MTSSRPFTFLSNPEGLSKPALVPKVLGVVLGVVLILYPFFIYFAVQQFAPRAISATLLAIFAARFLLLRGRAGLLKLNFLLPGTLLGLVFCLFVFSANHIQTLKFYPVIMNLFFLVVFAASLRYPPPVIERVARMMEPNLPPRGVLHARQVTIVWCLFFVANGSISLYTALYSSMEFWTLYNGLLSYLIMGGLFVVEYGVRRVRMAQDRREATELC